MHQEITAPVIKGSVIGELIITLNGETLAKTDAQSLILGVGGICRKTALIFQ